MPNLELIWRYSVTNPSWEQVVTALRGAKEDGSSVTLIQGGTEPGQPYRFTIEADEDVELYRPAMGIKGGGIRYYEKVSAGPGYVEFGGGDRLVSSLSDDFDLMIQMAKEFYETGNVKALKNPKDLFYQV